MTDGRTGHVPSATPWSAGNHRGGQAGRRSVNSSMAARSHPALIPLRCISHSTSATCGPRRQDGGPEPHSPPVTSLAQRSSTRRARISMGQLGVPTFFRSPVTGHRSPATQPQSLHLKDSSDLTSAWSQQRCRARRVFRALLPIVWVELNR